MTTINEIVTEHLGDLDYPDGFVPALKEREDVALEKLQLYAERFGLLRPVVSRVILELGLGDYDDATKAHIMETYQAFIDDYKEKVEAQVAGMRAIGIPVPETEFVDPFTIPLDIAVPDTPPEA